MEGIGTYGICFLEYPTRFATLSAELSKIMLNDKVLELNIAISRKKIVSKYTLLAETCPTQVILTRKLKTAQNL